MHFYLHGTFSPSRSPVMCSLASFPVTHSPLVALLVDTILHITRHMLAPLNRFSTQTDLRNMAKSCCPGYAALPVQRTNLKASGTPGAQHTGHSYASSFRTTTFIVNNTSSVKKPGQLLVSQKGPAMRATPVPDMITTSEIELVEAPSSHNARM